MKQLVMIFAVAIATFETRANTIVFNTLGPGGTYGAYSGDAVASQPNLLSEWAVRFIAGASGKLLTVDLGLTYRFAGSAGPVDVYLYDDAMGVPDNANKALLGSGTPTAQLGSTNDSLVSFPVLNGIPVTSGSTYWIVLKPGGTNLYDAWNDAFPLKIGTIAGSADDTTWLLNTGILPAFRLTAATADEVPDYGSTLLLSLCVVPAVLLIRAFASYSAKPSAPG